MTRPAPGAGLSRRTGRPKPAAPRRYGRAAGEPPLLGDPRRWGSLIGVAGGMVFVASYSSALGPMASMIAWTLGIAGVVATLFFLYVRPVPLGLVARPRPLFVVVYVGCVLGELIVIAAGSGALAAAHRSELRPALIAAVVGLHFMPFAWAFRERMFLYLGGAVAVIGAAGLLAGALGVAHAADAMAVVAGLLMLAFTTMFAAGRFVPRVHEQPVA